MTAIRIQGLTKRFGRTTAVDAVDLEIPSGSLFFLLGPSGCGKTTLLRMIAGFVEPTDGRIHFGDRDVTRTSPSRRGAGMVFQSYALWPHMTVRQNVGFGLSIRRVGAEERDRRTIAALRSVRMEDYAERKPNQLSGGQQQRVALARALVVEPTVLLLDEPLSNLDAKLRLEMRSEIRRICSETGITTVYVTHDQKEALSMADAMAVMKDGRVMQVGPPRQLYARPNSRFVTDFLGETNFLPAEVVGAAEGGVRLETPAGIVVSRAGLHASPTGGNVTCSIRPEALRFVGAKGPENSATGRRVDRIDLGEVAQHVVELDDGSTLKVLELNPRANGTPGEVVHVAFDPEDVVILED